VKAKQAPGQGRLDHGDTRHDDEGQKKSLSPNLFYVKCYFKYLLYEMSFTSSVFYFKSLLFQRSKGQIKFFAIEVLSCFSLKF
jgi:hypothetical protein